ncbi:MAG TPA: hypothetical protein VGF28_22350 [Thermoanaerobaculia bacterium]|jgi:hypothetical protein
MPTPVESATLNLKLFELRRDPVLREARQWWLDDFTPRTFEELAAVAGGERNASFRMVAGYWDMAASMVTYGAIDPDMFRAANPEMVGAVAKVYPFLAQLREASGIAEFMRHAEAVVVGMAGGVERMERLREQFLARRSQREG